MVENYTFLADNFGCFFGTKGAYMTKMFISNIMQSTGTLFQSLIFKVRLCGERRMAMMYSSGSHCYMRRGAFYKFILLASGVKSVPQRPPQGFLWLAESF